MKRLDSRATHRKEAAGSMALSPLACVLTALLFAIGCCAAMPASADDDKHPADVTITVVEDPEQLKEKINKIRLPDANEDARAVQKGGNRRESQQSASTGGQQRNEAVERQGGEKQPDAGREQRAAATEGHHDTSDKPSAVKPDKVDEDDTRHKDSKPPR